MQSAIKRENGDRVFDIINTLILSIILLLVLYPLIFVVVASISDPLLVVKGKIWILPRGLNIQGYKKVFENDAIIIGYLNTIMYTVLGTSINLVMTTLGAFPLSRKDLYGKNIFTAYFVFTMFFSGGLIPTYIVIKSLGLYNNIWVMVIPGAVSVFNMIIMRTFFQLTIPEELYEAAFMDGCSYTRVLFKIVLPLSMPVIAVMILFYGVGHWNSFFNALIYLKSREKYPLQLILREILLANQMDNMVDMNESSTQKILMEESIKYASIIVSSIPVLLLYPFLQKYFVQGVMIGAIKG